MSHKVWVMYEKGVKENRTFFTFVRASGIRMKRVITTNIINMKKILESDWHWLRAMQF